MSFRHQQLGSLVVSDPKRAGERLTELFNLHGSLTKVARALPADSRTVARWIDRIVDAGFADPRVASGVKRRATGSPAAKKKARALAARGFTPEQSAAQLGFAPKTIARWLKSA